MQGGVIPGQDPRDHRVRLERLQLAQEPALRAREEDVRRRTAAVALGCDVHQRRREQPAQQLGARDVGVLEEAAVAHVEVNV